MSFESSFVKKIMEGGEEELFTPNSYEVEQAEEVVDYLEEEYGFRKVAK